MTGESPYEDERSFEEWIGRRRVNEDTISRRHVRMLAATLDEDPERFDEGTPLPWGWHWIFFNEPVRRSRLGQDGHERRGDFLPPIPLQRRMWAGGRLTFVRPIEIGAYVERVSTVRSIELKEGRSGQLALVTIEHRLSDDAGLALEEQQDIVYLQRPLAGWAAPPRIDAPKSATDPLPPLSLGAFTADEVTLFRFSALTFNGHRIHYDRSFALEVERYPDIVVHGPLVALLLMGAGRRYIEARDPGLPDSGPAHFGYRALQPLFCHEPIDLFGTGSAPSESGQTVHVWAEHETRGAVMRAELRAGP